MSSYQQIAVGFFLLAVAFFFGSHLTQGNLNPGAGAISGSTARSESLDSSEPQFDAEQNAGAPPSVPRDSNGLPAEDPSPIARKQSLRDRLQNMNQLRTSVEPVLPERDSSTASEVGQIAKLPALKRSNDPVLDQEFARTQSEGSLPKIPAADLHIAKPDFSSLAADTGESPRPSNDLTVGASRSLDFNSSNSIARIRRTPTGFDPNNAAGQMVPVRSPSESSVELQTERFIRHTVQANETLQKIAQRYYGRAEFYLDIYLANQDELENPSSVQEGMQLKIPVYQ